MKLSWIGACLISVAALAACKSEEQRKTEYRTKALADCKNSIAGRAAPGLDADRFCNCLVDRVIGSRSTADLAKLDSNKAESDRVGTEAGLQCRSEQTSQTAPAAAPAPTEAPAPAPAASGNAAGPANSAEPGNATDVDTD